MWQHIRIILTSTVQFDDAFIANVAKNLANGHGYSASYYGLRPFHLEITTGPTVILPTALLIRVFGNQYWVPNFAYTLIVMTLTIVMLAVLHRRVRGRAFTVAAFVLGLALLALGRQEVGLLGEVPAALLIAVAALVAVSSDHDALSALELAGLTVGLALMSKMVAALAVPAFLAVMLTMPAYADKRAWSIRGFLVGAAAPVLAFEIYKLAGLGWNFERWAALTNAELSDVVGSTAALSGSGTLFRLGADPLLIVRNTVGHARILATWVGGTRNPMIPPVWFGGWLPTVAGFLSVAVAIWALQDLPEDRSTVRLIAAVYTLLATAALCLVWWLAIAPMGWIRHLTPGAICLFCGMSIAIGTIARYDLARAAMSGVLLVIALTPNLVNMSDPFGSYREFRGDLINGPP